MELISRAETAFITYKGLMITVLSVVLGESCILLHTKISKRKVLSIENTMVYQLQNFHLCCVFMYVSPVCVDMCV